MNLLFRLLDLWRRDFVFVLCSHTFLMTVIYEITECG